MKPLLRVIAAIILSFGILPVFAADPPRYFEKLSTYPDFNYNYISPTMLRLMGDQALSASGGESFNNYPIKCSDLTFIENLSTDYDSQNDEIWEIISKLKKDKKMETLITRKGDNSRYDLLVTMTGNHKWIRSMLVITQHGPTAVDIIYMEGNIPMEAIQNTFY